MRGLRKADNAEFGALARHPQIIRYMDLLLVAIFTTSVIIYHVNVLYTLSQML